MTNVNECKVTTLSKVAGLAEEFLLMHKSSVVASNTCDQLCSRF